jgi:hypothetical protein
MNLADADKQGFIYVKKNGLKDDLIKKELLGLTTRGKSM